MNKYSSSQCVTCCNIAAAIPYSKVFTITPWLEKTKITILPPNYVISANYNFGALP